MEYQRQLFEKQIRDFYDIAEETEIQRTAAGYFNREYNIIWNGWLAGVEANQSIKLAESLKQMCDTYGQISFNAGMSKRIPESDWLDADAVLTSARQLLAALKHE